MHKIKTTALRVLIAIDSIDPALLVSLLTLVGPLTDIAHALFCRS